MSKKIDTSGQFIEFYKKKGDYLVELSNNHLMNKEYKKSLELLSQAFAMYEKGGANELAEQTKAKFNEIKAKYFKK
ncbi:MAG: hypothetical protein JW891_05435 [Candidatus Lokiarchaeota archaeon]|nr:hypothetical protein [Candidatus Lokiarchaeota archaeon]